MSEPMTLDEAVRVMETATIYARGTEASRAYATIRAHAERTVEARSDEPEAVKRLREAPVWHLVTDYIDTLTAERDAARERSEYWKAEHAAANEVIDTLRADRDRLAACVERATEWIKVLADGEFTSPFKVDPLERAKSHIAAIEHSAADILAALEGK